MNLIIPFESKVSFASEVKEISSISLEHEITKNDSEILGNFLISGTYKEHELSINTLDFNFVVPFSLQLETQIDKDTLDFSIDNFTYDIEGKQMTVKIDYQVVANEIVRESVPIDPVDLIEESTFIAPLEDENIQNNLEIQKQEEDNRISHEAMQNITKQMPFEDINIDIENNLMQMEEDWQTYHVHMIKEEETIDTIALIYKITKEDILNINNITDLKNVQKLLIPIINE